MPKGFTATSGKIGNAKAAYRHPTARRFAAGRSIRFRVAAP
jgi:hypothetical protein